MIKLLVKTVQSNRIKLRRNNFRKGGFEAHDLILLIIYTYTKTISLKGVQQVPGQSRINKKKCPCAYNFLLIRKYFVLCKQLAAKNMHKNKTNHMFFRGRCSFVHCWPPANMSTIM